MAKAVLHKKKIIHRHIGFKFKEETNKQLHGAGDHMDRPCTKCSITRCRGGEEYPAYNKKKEV
jgi:hypothetical protein